MYRRREGDTTVDWLTGVVGPVRARRDQRRRRRRWAAWQIRGSLTPGDGLVQFVRENWTFGRWLLGGELLQWWSSLQMYLWLTADLLGDGAAGDLRATQTLFGPMRIFTFYLGSVLPIRFARELARVGQYRRPPPVHAGVRPRAAAAGRVLRGRRRRAGADPAPGVRPEVHQPRDRVLSLYAAYTFISYLPVLLASVLTAKRVTRPVFMGNVYGAVLALPVGWYLIRTMGERGAPVAMGICSALMTVYFVRAYADSNRARPAGFPVALPVPAAEAAPAGGEAEG